MSQEPPALPPPPREPEPPIAEGPAGAVSPIAEALVGDLSPIAEGPAGEVLPVAAATPTHPVVRTGRFRRLVARLTLRPRERGVVLRGAVVLAIVGFCLAAFIVQLSNLKAQPPFVNENQVSKSIRMQVLGWLGLGLLGGFGLALGLVLRGTRAGRAARVMRTARLLSPFLIPGLAFPLLLARNWDALPRIGGVAVVSLLGEATMRAAALEMLSARLALARVLMRVVRAFGSWLGRGRRFVSPAGIAVLLGVTFYAVWMSAYTIVQHRQFGTMAFDLGSYNTTFFNALVGHPFRSTTVIREGADWSMLSNHAEFTMYALLPFYALRPGPETLLVLQAVALASGAVPLYRFAARRLPVPVATILALAYLLYAPMHQANFYDVHFQPFGAAFTLWAFDALDARQPALFALFFALALGCREDVPIGFVIVGLYLLLTGQKARAAVAMMAVALTYFIVVKFVVMPQFGSWWFSDLYKDLYPPGENSYGGVVKTLLTNPVYVWKTLVTTEKMVYLLLVLTPLVFLPLRRGLLWMSLLPAALFTLMTTGYGPTVEISFQYVCLYIPFIFLAAVLALDGYGRDRLGRARLWGSAGAIVLATVLTSRVWGAMPPGDKFRGGFREISRFEPTSNQQRRKLQDIRELMANVPADAAVAVSELEHPHVSTRLNCYALRLGYEGAEYILFQEGSGDYGANNARKALDSGQYEQVARRDSGIVMLRRKK